MVISEGVDHPAICPACHFTTVGFFTRPVIFTTGPPGLPPTDPTLVSPSRAPPRLLAA
jgi:hypothetical protein